MAGLKEIKETVVSMADKTMRMWQLAYDAFIEHDEDLITQALEEENKINALEDEVNKGIIDLGKSPISADEKFNITLYANIAADFELIGDYCKDILERVQIKINEHLLFSEDAVEEYKELYNRTKISLEEVVFALQRDNPGLIKEVLKKEEHIDSLVDRYRSQHNERLVAGKCTPLGCNLFLNMLDFTAAIYYHTKKIAKSLLKIKE
jgi:phosphate:Na+ symporter